MASGFNIEAVLSASKSFANSFIPLLLTGLAVIAGLVILYFAIRDLYRKGEGRHAGQEVGYGAIALKFLVGGMLLRFGAFMQDISFTLFGAEIQGSTGVLAYMPIGVQAGFWKQVLEVCLLWIVMLGWAGAFRGLLLWNSAANGGQSGGSSGDLFWRGLWHLIGGAVAVNLTGAIQAFLG